MCRQKSICKDVKDNKDPKASKYCAIFYWNLNFNKNTSLHNLFKIKN